jgi:uncharacterized protein YecE (DUF72 family)
MGQAMNIWLGTSGYSYPEWAGGFFPPSLPPARRFSYYARRFPFVELTDCQRLVPTGDLFRHYARMASEEFRFSVLAPNSVTQEQSYRDLHQFRESIGELNGMLKAVIVEFPQSYHHSSANRRWVEIVADTLNGHHIGFEFAHWTWARPDVMPWMERLGTFLVANEASQLMPLNRTLYARIHTRDPEIWKRSAKERLDFEYAEPMLNDWADGLMKASPNCDDAYIVFSNARDLSALANAESFAELLKTRPGLRVIEPSGPPMQKQPTLF